MAAALSVVGTDTFLCTDHFPRIRFYVILPFGGTLEYRKEHSDGVLCWMRYVHGVGPGRRSALVVPRRCGSTANWKPFPRLVKVGSLLQTD